VTAPSESGLLAASRTMAAGTIASRATGFLRTAVIAAVVGTGLFGDAYNVANTAPNIVYELLLGGVLTSVVVPLLVRHRAESADGEIYAQRLLTLVVVGLVTATVLAILLAPFIVDLYMHTRPHDVTPQRFHDERHLATTFLRLFLPQIAFYGIGATVGAILNVRGHFAAPMWAPVLNNVVVILTGAIYLATVNGKPVPGDVSTGAIALLGIGTTAGIVAQTAALLPPLRRAGFRWRWRFDWHGSGVGEIATVGKWIFVYVLANQIGYLVVVQLATASSLATTHRALGYSSYLYAFLLFSLPHAVVTVSVVTALLPTLSRHAHAGAYDEMRDGLSRGMRLSAALLVPSTAGLVALSAPVAVLVFAHHSTTLASAHYVGRVLLVFALGLVPFSFFQLLLRGWYALGDTRTPALFNVWVNVVNIVADLVAYFVLPDVWRVVGLAAGYGLSYVVGLALIGRSLGKRIGGLDSYLVTRTVVRLAVASLPAAVLAWVASWAARSAFGGGLAGSAVGLVFGLAVGVGLFVPLARRMRVHELASVLGALVRRTG
jgi:putative peptidoglycan lipid II flippase